jgi:hypothetical protein
VIVDISGWIDFGAETRTPVRAVDTRPIGRLKKGEILVVPLSRHGVPIATSAIFVTVTATNSTSTGYLTVYPCGTVPNSSNLNYPTSSSKANAAIGMISPGGEICIYSSTETDVIVDITGWSTDNH